MSLKKTQSMRDKMREEKRREKNQIDPGEWQGWERAGAGKCKLGTISTGKGEKVKNCSQWENHEPSSRRGTLGMDAGNNVCA